MAIVQSKKIAICNYGGWFALNDDGSIACCGWEAYAVDVHENMQLNDFKKEVAQTIDSSVEGLVVKSFLPGSTKKYLIDVLTDDDFNKIKSDSIDSEQLEVFIIQEPSPVDTNRLKNGPAETEAAANLLPAEQGPVPNLTPLDEVVDIETITEVTPIPDPTHHEPPLAAKQWENLITGVGQRFNSLAELRETLKQYAIAHGFNYVYKKNEKGRLTVKCKSENCQWRLHASSLKTTEVMCIKTMTATHSCQVGAVTTALRAQGSSIGELIMERVKDNPKIKPNEIAEKLKSEYGVEVNYSKARRAREHAREQLLGSYKDVCSEVAYMCEKLMEVNPGSVAKLSTDKGFHLFVAFNASISGFIRGCRPLLFLDMTPFNSRMLLTATSADGNDKAFPVAFAVVDEENDDSWRWFLTELKSLVSGQGPITFVMKGLSKPLGDVFGAECYHAFCLEYLTIKLNKDLAGHFPNDRLPMFVDLYRAAQTSKPEDFEKYMQAIQAESLEAYNWIIRSEPDRWANARFGGLPYNHLPSNLGQEFYSCVSKANKLSITQLVHKLRDKMMCSIYTRRAESSQWVTQLTPSMEERLRIEILEAQSAKVLEVHVKKFEVLIGKRVEIVDMENCSCSCRVWLLTGLPCCHAIAALEVYGRSPYDYCSSYFNVETYHRVYEDSTKPIPNLERITYGELDDGLALVTQSTVWTPGVKKRKVEPVRVVPADFVKRPLQCGRCKGFGHNKRSCKEVIQKSATTSKKG